MLQSGTQTSTALNSLSDNFVPEVFLVENRESYVNSWKAGSGKQSLK